MKSSHPASSASTSTNEKQSRECIVAATLRTSGFGGGVRGQFEMGDGVLHSQCKSGQSTVAGLSNSIATVRTTRRKGT
jgi:hypothetical protein